MTVNQGRFGGMKDAKGTVERKKFPVGNFVLDFLACVFLASTNPKTKNKSWLIFEFRIIDSTVETDGRGKIIGREVSMLFDTDGEFFLANTKELIETLFSSPEELAAWAAWARSDNGSGAPMIPEQYPDDDQAQVTALFVDPVGAAMMRAQGARVIALSEHRPSQGKYAVNGLTKNPVPRWRLATDEVWKALAARPLPAPAEAAPVSEETTGV